MVNANSAFVVHKCLQIKDLKFMSGFYAFPFVDS